MISTAKADALIAEAYAAQNRTHPTERLPLAQAVGRILDVDVVADRDQPPFHRVAMDGIALALPGDSAPLPARVRLDGRLWPGISTPEGPARPAPGNAIEVMTGAALPEPWNTVIPVEDLTEDREDNGDYRTIRSGTRIVPGMNIHVRASDYRQGDPLFSRGTVITPPHIHVLASVGWDPVPVVAMPRIALVSTGDELVPVRETPLPHQIRMSNLPAIEACLAAARLPVGSTTHLPDDPDALHAGLRAALAAHDVVITSGGVSKGSRDFLPATLEALGCVRVFHGVAHKPGKPLWFGVAETGALVFALPGNPVSSLVCFVRYVSPLLRCWGRPYDGAGPFTLPLAGDTTAHPSFTLFLPASRARRPDGSPTIGPRKSAGSGNFAGLVPSDGFVEIPAGAGTLSAGTPVPFFPWTL